MHLISHPRPVRPGRIGAIARVASPCPQPSQAPGGCLAHLNQAYRDLGGVVSGDALGVLLREHCGQPISLLARWIVDRRVISVDAGGQHWIPMFQFDPGTLQPHWGVEQVIAELRGAYDSTELALWFATPSSWLDGARPAELLAGNPAVILEAARADRFVTLG